MILTNTDLDKIFQNGINTLTAELNDNIVQMTFLKCIFWQNFILIYISLKFIPKGQLTIRQ